MTTMPNDVCLHERMTERDINCRDCGAFWSAVEIVPEQYAAARAWAGLFMWCEASDGIPERMLAIHIEHSMQAWQSLRDWLDGTAEEWAMLAEDRREHIAGLQKYIDEQLGPQIDQLRADARLMARALDARYTAIGRGRAQWPEDIVAAIGRHLEAGR